VTSPVAATTTDEPAPPVNISWPWRLASVVLVLALAWLVRFLERGLPPALPDLTWLKSVEFPVYAILIGLVIVFAIPMILIQPWAPICASGSSPWPSCASGWSCGSRPCARRASDPSSCSRRPRVLSLVLALVLASVIFSGFVL